MHLRALLGSWLTAALAAAAGSVVWRAVPAAEAASWGPPFATTSTVERARSEERGELRVLVLDEHGERPACAHVRLSGPRYGGHGGTDAKGRIRFVDVPLGMYRLEVRPCGADASTTLVSVGSPLVSLELRVAPPRTVPSPSRGEPPAGDAQGATARTTGGLILTLGVVFSLDVVSDGEGGPTGHMVSPALFAGGLVSPRASLGVLQSFGTADGVRGPGLVLAGAGRISLRKEVGALAFIGYRFRTSRNGSEPGQWVMGIGLDWSVHPRHGRGRP